MPAQSIDSQILKYLPHLEHEQKKSLLTVIKAFLKQKDNTPSHAVIEEYNRELEMAEARIDAGEFTSQDDAKKIAKSWF